jgi:sec-independent protein translocase protein TatA
MFGLGFGEIIIIVFFILVFFGSKEIPDLARTIAKMIKQVKHASNELKQEIVSSIDVQDVKEKIGLNDIQQEIDKAKRSVNNSLENSTAEIKQTVEDFENLTGPIKRQK